MASGDFYAIEDGKKVYFPDYTDSVHEIAQVASMFCSLTMAQVEALLTVFIRALVDKNQPTAPNTLGLDIFDIAPDHIRQAVEHESRDH